VPASVGFGRSHSPFKVVPNSCAGALFAQVHLGVKWLTMPSSGLPNGSRSCPTLGRTQNDQMPTPHISATLAAALFFTVALLVTTTYFLMSSVPLLVLKHDTPMDSRFVRAFFNTNYLITIFAASASSLSYLFSGWLVLAAAAAALALLAIILRRKVIPKMDALRPQLESGVPDAIAVFRRTHLAAILINLAQLAVIVWCLIAVSLSLR
jgi:hypothetical protein